MPARAILISATGTLTCRSCRVEKPVTGFFREKAYACGYNTECKTCQAEWNRAYNARPEVLLRKRNQRRDNYRAGGRSLEYAREYRAKIPCELRMLRSARVRAKRDGVPFAIDIEDVRVPEFCPLLGIKIQRAIGRRGAAASSPSLDRIDPSKGYVKGNVWVVSYRANAIKQNATAAELRLIADALERRIYSAA